MKIIGSRWRSFEYLPVAAGPGAVALPPGAVRTPRRFFDCLLVRLVVEPGDGPATAAAVRAVRKLCADSDASFIVLTGSPHCAAVGSRSVLAGDPPDILTDIADTLDILAEVADRLEEHGERVHLIPFGWNLDCRLEEPQPAWASTTLTLKAPADRPVPAPRGRPHCPHALISARSNRARIFRRPR
ncbi:hypothetical protein [Nocardia veterana]|uniref:Uncharacterized protein n=1 Tax=Nocardia veterana TaxID=132249 RepID=A0A7X6LV35_9NOCA|nr:hypothetical protein [Nocardia veterana]NKY85068.1 hypothetical protein [Nocardia veterana]